MTNLIQNWWLVVLRGVAAILFGLAAFLWPGLTLLVLVVLFGAYALADGLIAVITGLSHAKDSQRWWFFVLEGLVGITAGLIALFRPGMATLVIVAVIAAWAILTGILEIAAAIRLRREITNEWLLAVGGILSVVVGVLLIVQPLAGSLAIVWIIGAYSLVFGITLVSLGVRLRSWQQSDPSQKLYPHSHSI